MHLAYFKDIVCEGWHISNYANNTEFKQWIKPQGQHWQPIREPFELISPAQHIRNK